MIFAAGEPGAAAKSDEPAPGPGLEQIKYTRTRSVGLIPPRFNLQTELKAEVKAGGPNIYIYELKK
jgi:hypothetical protein